jgi:hypothetical protein
VMESGLDRPEKDPAISGNLTIDQSPSRKGVTQCARWSTCERPDLAGILERMLAEQRGRVFDLTLI